MNITNKKLAYWIFRQRDAYSRGSLSEQRISALEKIPGWTWNNFDAAWDQGFKQLQKYGIVSARQKTKDDYPLGKWISHQRDDYKKGILNSERIEKLESIPDWVWDMQQSQFDASYEYLKRYGVVSKSFIAEDGFPLGMWIRNIKSSYTRGRLNQYKIDKLEAIPGWLWRANKN